RTLCRSHPQRREAGGPADRPGDQVRADHQCPDRKNPQIRDSRQASRARRRGDRMKRREFITLLSGTAASGPLAARVLQNAMPVVGFLHDGSFEPRVHLIAAFRQGLSEAGLIDGRNVVIEYRWAQDQFDRLPGMAADLVNRQVAVIATPGSTAAALAAKAATDTIPIVFSVGADPVKLGLVASLNRPGGNVTGVSYFTNELGPKRLGLLLELTPGSADVVVLANPKNPATDASAKDIQAVAAAVGRQLSMLYVTNNREMDAAFPTIAQKRAPALMIIPNALFTSPRAQPGTLSTRTARPAISR